MTDGPTESDTLIMALTRSYLGLATLMASGKHGYERAIATLCFFKSKTDPAYAQTVFDQLSEVRVMQQGTDDKFAMTYLLEMSRHCAKRDYEKYQANEANGLSALVACHRPTLLN